MISIAKIAVDTRIAIAAAEAEQKHALALGAGYFEAYSSSYRVLDEIMDRASMPMPPDTLTRFKP